jgi:hypothetical protein
MVVLLGDKNVVYVRDDRLLETAHTAHRPEEDNVLISS